LETKNAEALVFRVLNSELCAQLLVLLVFPNMQNSLGRWLLKEIVCWLQWNIIVLQACFGEEVFSDFLLLLRVCKNAFAQPTVTEAKVSAL
jgi:hypothetical protein